MIGVRCISFVPEEVAPEPILVLCKREKCLRECHYDCSSVTILEDPTCRLLLKASKVIWQA